MSTRLERRLVAKTAAYTITSAVDRAGTIFTNRGATGSVTFTLPAPNAALVGWWYEFFGVADQDIVVSAGTGKAVALNNASAASLAHSTSSQKIGGSIVALCDGTSWLMKNDTDATAGTVA